MKNRLLLLIVSMLLLSSCVKQRSCVCTSTHLDIAEYYFSETIFYTATKKSALENCAANEDAVGPVITSCELK